MSSPFFILASAIFFVASFPTRALSQCASFGNDIGDGSTNYINPTSGAEFSYQGGFQGCIAETCTATLQTADGTTLDCSSVSTTQTDYESVCPIQHSQMTPGAYTIFLTCPNNGILFGRGFSVVNTQATSTSTVTATVTGTVTPVSTLTSVSTSTEVDTSTLPPQTTTLPSATAGVISIHPETTITRTKTIVHTTVIAITTSKTMTKTAHASCTSAARTPDGRSRVAASSTSSTSASSTMAARRAHPRDFVRYEILAGRKLIKRVGPDGPLTTTITVSASPVIVLTTTSPASTITVPSLTVVVSTSTVTPPVQTVFSGSVASTVTAPVKTKTTTARLQETTTETVTRTVKFVVTATSAASAC